MTSKFSEPTTRVKISPDSYVQFDGSDHVFVRNIQHPEALRIKYDILLILYDMVDWKSVGEVLAPWPPDDQVKIVQSLDRLYEGKIIVTDESELQAKSESGLPEHLGSNIHINIENHHAMLRDNVRLAAYRRAIERHMTPKTVAMDLGCGTGILSFFAARAGAQKVYAIERRPDIILLAQELAKANGLEQVTFLEGTSSQIRETDLSPKPDVLIAEILGNGILEENVLEFTMDARDRFLAPGGRLIPERLDIFLFAFDAGTHPNRNLEVRELEDLYGLDLSLYAQVLCNKATLRLDRYNDLVYKTMSEPQVGKTLDFQTLKDAYFSEDLTVTAKEAGQITGFCAYFKAYLDEETTLTNSPWAPSTHWTHLIYSLPAPRPVQEGETIDLSMVYDGALRIRLADSV